MRDKLIKETKTNKYIDIKEEVINQRYGLKYINIEDKKKLKEQLNILRNDKLLHKYNVTYTLTEYENYIALLLHKPMSFIPTINNTPQ